MFSNSWWRRIVSTSLTAAVAVLVATLLVVVPSSNEASAQNAQCTTNTYEKVGQAKDNFVNDCGVPFENTSAYRCDWVDTGGWQCSGPGSSASSSPVTADGRCWGGVYESANLGKVHFNNDCGGPFQNTSAYRCDWVDSGGWQCSGPDSQSASQQPIPEGPIPAGPDRCQGDAYESARLAKDNFINDCGTPFLEEPEYRCTYSDGFRGWVCNGPGENRFITNQASSGDEPFTILGLHEGTRAIISWVDDEGSTDSYTIRRDGVVMESGIDLTGFEDRNVTRSTHAYSVTVATAGKPNRVTQVVLTGGQGTQIEALPARFDEFVIPPPPPSSNLQDLKDVQSGVLVPDPDTRLGAYAATLGYPEGTVGYAANQGIGLIYLTLGTVGQEQIGTVFNSPEAIALYALPVDGPASRALADLEFQYWASRPLDSLGGFLGSLFFPSVRDLIQRILGGTLEPEPEAPSPDGSGSSGSGDSQPFSEFGDPFDLDEDGILDWQDDDIDGDGVRNEQDSAPRDPAFSQPGQTEPNEDRGDDNDGDGIPDDFDLDDDNDGVPDVDDYFPNDPSKQSRPDGASDETPAPGTDTGTQPGQQPEEEPEKDLTFTGVCCSG